MDFYLSGTLLFTADPVNIHIENINMDLFMQVGGFVFFPNWNYPGAFVTPTVYVRNFTTYLSAIMNQDLVPVIFYYGGPGNITITDIDITRTFIESVNGITPWVSTTEGTCIPDDGLTKVFNYSNIKISLKDNSFGTRNNNVLVNIGVTSGRPHLVYYENFTVSEAYNSGLPYFGYFGTAADSIYLENIHYENYYSSFSSLGLQGGDGFYITNITFKDAIPSREGVILASAFLRCEFRGFNVINYSGDANPATAIIFLQIYPSAALVFEDFNIVNADLKGQQIVRIGAPLSSMHIDGVNLSNVTVASAHTFFLFQYSIIDMSMNDVTLNKVSSSDPTDTSAVILKTSSLDLSGPNNYSVTNINFNDSSISVVSFLSLTNTPSSTKYFHFTDLTLNNCHFMSQRSILNTEKADYELDIIFEFSRMTFTDISFETKGLLMEIDHQLTSNLTISDSTFTNIELGWIEIASTN